MVRTLIRVFAILVASFAVGTLGALARIHGHSLIGSVLLLFSIGLKVSGLIYFAVTFVKALRKVITART